MSSGLAVWSPAYPVNMSKCTGKALDSQLLLMGRPVFSTGEQMKNRSTVKCFVNLQFQFMKHCIFIWIHYVAYLSDYLFDLLSSRSIDILPSQKDTESILCPICIYNEEAGCLPVWLAKMWQMGSSFPSRAPLWSNFTGCLRALRHKAI